MLKLVERSGKWHIHGTHLGVRVRESTGLPTAETAKAELLLAKKIHEIESANGVPQAPSSSGITLRDLMLQQAELKVLDGYSPEFAKFSKVVIRKIGELADLDARHVVANEVEIKKKLTGLTVGGTANYMNRIRSALKFGVERGLVPSDTPIVRVHKCATFKDTTWNEEEIEAVTKYLTKSLDLWGSVILIALHTALRIGEVSRIKLDTVDLVNRTFQVEPTGYARTKTKPRVHPIRQVVLPVFEWVVKNHACSKNKYLYGKRDNRGKFKQEPNARSKQFGDLAMRRMKKMEEDIGVRRIRIHDLRHTIAKYLVKKKAVDPYELKELMGHSTVKMTERYIGKIGLTNDLVRRLDEV